MENDVIFTNHKTVMQPVQAGAPPVAPVHTAQPVSPAPPAVLHKRSNTALFIRIGMGVVGLIVFLLLLFMLILPRFQKEQAVAITVWGLWDDPKVMQELITDFEKMNPLIKVSYVKQDLIQYRERLTSRIPSGTGPDIYYFHNSWVPQLSGLLAPLPLTVISPATFQKTYYPVAQTDLIKKGAIYGLPLGIDTLALFVNTDLQKTAGGDVPQNWDDFNNTVQKLTVKDEGGKIEIAGTAMGTIDNISHSFEIISLLFAQNGVNLHAVTSFATPITEALKFYTEYASGENMVWGNTLDPSLTAFSKGKLAYFFGYSWDIFNVKTLSPSLSFAVYPVPSLPSRTMTIASYWAAGVSSKTKQQKAANLFLSFLTQKETAQKLYTQAIKTRGFGMPYARQDLAGTLKSDSLIYPFVQQAKGAVSTYFASDTFDNGLNTKMNAYLGNAVRKILDTSSPESATDELIKGVIQVQSEYGL